MSQPVRPSFLLHEYMILHNSYTGGLSLPEPCFLHNSFETPLILAQDSLLAACFLPRHAFPHAIIYSRYGRCRDSVNFDMVAGLVGHLPPETVQISQDLSPMPIDMGL